MKNQLLAALVVFTMSACSSDDGAAPTIATLAYTPMTVPTGVQSTISGTFTFEDKDGDAAQIGIDVRLPDNSTQELPLSNLQNVGEMTSGTINFAVIIAPPVAGTYQFEVFIVDDADNESNHLMGSLTAN